MLPKQAKAIVSAVQGIVSFADPLDLGEPDHLGSAHHDYDDVAARAAAVLMRGGSAWKAVSMMQQVFRSEWGASMTLLTRWRLSRRLKKYVVRRTVRPAIEGRDAQTYVGVVEPAPPRAQDSTMPEGGTCLVCDATAVATLQVTGPADIERFGSRVYLCVECDGMIRAEDLAGLSIRSDHDAALAVDLVRIASNSQS